MDELHEIFPFLSRRQIEQFKMLQGLYTEWNKRINVISRKDMDFIYEHHILHSLGIAKVVNFMPEAKILDVGTGGGFPGIPLAILFPETEFYLIDSIGKKIKVTSAIADVLELKNVKAEQIRAENVKHSFDFVVSRAVTSLPEFYQWVRNKFSHHQQHKIPNGILYLKGGDFLEELNVLPLKWRIYELKDYFKGDFFETKKVVHMY